MSSGAQARSSDPGPAAEGGLDLDAVRAQFPSLTREVGGRAVAWLDGPGGTQVPQRVIDRVVAYFQHSNSNTDGHFAAALETEQLIHDAKAAVGDLLGADPAGVAFGGSMTTLNFALAHAVARTCSPGDRIVVTELDHEGNVSPWLQVARDRGLEVDVARGTAGGTLDVEHLESLLTERTRVVAFTLASNALGSITPVERVVAAAHRVGALAWADAVHFTPHRRVRKEQWGLDVLLTSAYKWCGPHLGIAALTPSLAAELPTDRVRVADPSPPGHRVETGTLAHELVAGTLEAVEYLADLSGVPDQPRASRLDAAYDRLDTHEHELAERFMEGLEGLDHVTLHGVADRERLAERTATFLLDVRDRNPGDVARVLGDRGFFTWHGDFYAPGAVRSVGLGPDGGLRIGLAHYNSTDEVDGVLAELDALR